MVLPVHGPWSGEELPVPDQQCDPVLPPATHPAPRPQATEPAH